MESSAGWEDFPWKRKKEENQWSLWQKVKLELPAVPNKTLELLQNICMSTVNIHKNTLARVVNTASKTLRNETRVSWGSCTLLELKTKRQHTSPVWHAAIWKFLFIFFIYIYLTLYTQILFMYWWGSLLNVLCSVLFLIILWKSVCCVFLQKKQIHKLFPLLTNPSL